jgi:CheY-like chemotaxis protein
MSDSGRILIVDDNQINRMILSRVLTDQGHESATAENGREALERLVLEPFDVILLDILMPEMDGYEMLQRIKQDPDLRHLPVIVISSVDEMESVLRCIELGAADYLPKPFNAPLLRARINASLAHKRLRYLEIEYLEQVNRVMDAAGAVEAGSFEESSLDPVAHRSDALGQLARVFQRMAREVHQREQRLRQQVEDLRIEIDEARQNKQVAEIIETDYFRTLSSQADTLRSIINGIGADESVVT